MRSLAVAVLALALALLTGCASAGDVALREWTFVGPDGARAPLTLPAHVDGRVPRERVTYALITDVTLDPSMQGRDVVLAIPWFLGRTTLKANGERLRQQDEENPRSYRALGPHAWTIPARSTRGGRVVLELDVDYSWVQAAWIDTVPYLTLAPDGGTAYVARNAFNAVTSGGAFAFALFAGYLYGVIYLSNRRNKRFFWFALTGLSGFTYPMFQLGVARAWAGPIETLLVGLGVSTAVIGELHFTAAYYELPRPARAWDVAWLASAIATVGSLGYFRNTYVAGVATIAFVVPALASQVALLVRLARRKPPPRHLVTVLGGWAVLSLIAIPDFQTWLGLGDPLGGTKTACMGIWLIAMLQTATISRAHTESLRDAEALNDELRRQIAARSKQLADALARLGTGPTERALDPGTIVEGRYEIQRVLGAGAGGTVYLVERLADRAPLAMKVVRGGDDAHALARLAREAQLASEVKHPNVIAIVDVDVAASGFLYVVMEYVAGDTLREHATEYGNLAWALPVLAQIADGLAVIHARGIIHRDLKPANVLVVARADGEAPLVKISDFGIARGERAARVTDRPPGPIGATQRERAATVRDGDARLTQTGVMMGTPLYMAPEAVGGAREATPAVDVFALGIIAWELVVGRAPFRDSPALAQLDGLSVAPAPPLLTERADCPAEVARVIDRCLAFEPEDRPTAREIVAAFARAQVTRGATSA